MINLSSMDFKKLRKAELIHDGNDGKEKNYITLNRQKPARRRRYLVIETEAIKKFFGTNDSLKESKKTKKSNNKNVSKNNKKEK